MSEVLRLLRSREGAKLVIAGNRRNFEYSALILRSNIWHGKDSKNLHSDSLLQYGSIYRSDYFTIELSQEELRQITAKTFFTGSRTFRKGRIGGWRNHFTEEHKQAFKEVRGDTLIRSGYEKDYDW